ncbi:copper resistance system multicopper oxidase [Geminicoccus roseus]|uniref:copper resistance system multicopper oxidase n=1 Tax=Geminicoccus roseus TaxID=404900 RepID=UPI00146FB9D6|nr:copper resistance system multicopper oxidase [Geminicoccus roseus]
MMPRNFLGALGLVLAATAASTLASPSLVAGTYDLVIEEQTLNVTGVDRPGMVINGQFPGAPLRLKEGEDVTINVTNRLDEVTSVHWHGLLLPSSEDGVPGVSDGFDGIMPGTTHTYRFPVRQAGTYWFHSHSGVQEQLGVYAPIVIEPQKREPFRYDREYIIQLSDWTDENPERIIDNLKRDPGYYNYSKPTWSDLVRDLWNADSAEAKKDVVQERWAWAKMRMDRTDIADVTGYTFLVNGQSPERNFTALFEPGERIRLRFINSSAMTYFDVRIPGLKMTVVQADGNNVQPTPVDEFRIAVAETYDVIVRPDEDRAYSILAESMDRTGFARATLATRKGMVEPLPAHRPRPMLTMADMGMSFGPTGLERGTPRPETDAPGHVPPMDMDHGDMAGMDHAKTDGMGDMAGMDHSNMKGMGDMAGMDHSKMEGMGDMAGMAMADPIAVDTGAPAGTKVLSYRDLKALASPFDAREPDRIIEVRLTGNMERYFWSINGNKFADAQPIVLNYGERVRFRFINETMMNHPMHLHGMWMLPRVGNDARDPLKHVVNIKPGTSLDVDIPVDAEGGWAFHCHLLYHMETGMMRKVVVQRQTAAAE